MYRTSSAAFNRRRNRLKGRAYPGSRQSFDAFEWEECFGMNKIPLIDLKRQYLTIKEEIDAAIQSVLNSACFILGEPVEAFEKSFAQACGVEFGVGASSGTTALYLALTTLGIGAGDEVITTANTFIATTEAISQTGARVIFADI